MVNGVLLPPKPNEIHRLPYTTISSGQTRYWRLANASADTILDLEMLVNGVSTPVQVTTRDGVPLVNVNGHPTWQPVPMDHVYLDPAARVEFFLMGTNPGDEIVHGQRALRCVLARQHHRRSDDARCRHDADGLRAKNIIGEFVYHCHILEHEDNGMMAMIRVIP